MIFKNYPNIFNRMSITKQFPVHIFESHCIIYSPSSPASFHLSHWHSATLCSFCVSPSLCSCVLTYNTTQANVFLSLYSPGYKLVMVSFIKECHTVLFRVNNTKVIVIKGIISLGWSWKLNMALIIQPISKTCILANTVI